MRVFVFHLHSFATTAGRRCAAQQGTGGQVGRAGEPADPASGRWHGDVRAGRRIGRQKGHLRDRHPSTVFGEYEHVLQVCIDI